MEELFDNQLRDITAIVEKYNGLKANCRVEAQGIKRRHSDDDPDNHPNEGEKDKRQSKKHKKVEGSSDRVLNVEKRTGETKAKKVTSEEQKNQHMEQVYHEAMVLGQEEKVNEAFKCVVQARKRELRDYEDEDNWYPTKYDWENRLKQSDVKECYEEMIRKENMRLQKEHTELYKYALTNDFGEPKFKDIDLEVQKTIHKRINQPFMEDQVRDFYVDTPRKIKETRLHGYTKYEQELWFKLKHIIHEKQQEPEKVHSLYPITHVQAVKSKFHNGLEYTTFKVVRTNGKVYEFSEADFANLNPNDIEHLFLSMKRWSTKTRVDRLAEDRIKRFMEMKVKEASFQDFQMALEGGKGKVNLAAPQQSFEFSHVSKWAIVNLGNKGIVYTSPHWKGNVVMFFNEVHHFSTGTLRLIKDEIETIIKNGDAQMTEDFKDIRWKAKRIEYELGKDAIEKCLENRKFIQRYEMHLKIRENRYSIYATIKARRKQQEQDECAKMYPEPKDQAQSSQD